MSRGDDGPLATFRPSSQAERSVCVFQVTVLRGENASAKSLHSVVQTLESDKVKLELKVKNLELQLKENKRQLSSSSGRGMPTWCSRAPLYLLLLTPTPTSPSCPQLSHC